MINNLLLAFSLLFGGIASAGNLHNARPAKAPIIPAFSAGHTLNTGLPNPKALLPALPAIQSPRAATVQPSVVSTPGRPAAVRSPGSSLDSSIGGRAQAAVRKVFATFFGPEEEAGYPFLKGQQSGSIQIGVNPRTLIPVKDLSTLAPARLQDAVEHGQFHAIDVTRDGEILDGHHRTRAAIEGGRAVDVIVH